MNIPVFHDDQHGTAIISLAAIINALKVTGKKIEECRFVVNGAGAWLFTTDFFIAATTNSPAFSAASTVSVSSLEAGLYFLPFFFSREALNGACFSSLSCSSAETFQYSCGLNASISRSLSTISFSATDCTLPPESVRELFSVSILWFSRVESL